MSGGRKTAIYLAEIVVAAWLGVVVAAAFDTAREIVVVTEQPTPFDHKTHRFRCVVCHADAYRNDAAGLPGIADCIECHNANDERKKSELTDGIRAKFESNEEIRWRKYTNVPNHVVFSHKAHVKWGKLDCAECHGTIETSAMKSLPVVVPTMDDCMKCHEEKHVSNDCYTCHK